MNEPPETRGKNKERGMRKRKSLEQQDFRGSIAKMDGLPWGFKGICACAAPNGLAQSDLDVPGQVPFPLTVRPSHTSTSTHTLVAQENQTGWIKVQG